MERDRIKSGVALAGAAALALALAGWLLSGQQPATTGTGGAGIAESDGLAPGEAALLEAWSARLTALPDESRETLLGLYLEAQQVQPSDVRERVMRLLVAHWLKRAPQSLADGLFRYTMPALLGQVAELLPACLARGPVTAELTAVREQFTAAFAATDPVRMRDWALRHLSGAPRDEALAAVVNYLPGASRADALALLDRIEAPHARASAADGLGLSWARENAQEALAWAEGLEPGPARDMAMRGVFNGMAEQDPAQVRDRLAAWAGHPEFASLAITVSEKLGATAPRETMAWAESLPGGRMREMALEYALRAWAQQDPDGALAHYAQRHAEDPDLARSLFRMWPDEDLGRADRLMRSLPDGEARAQAADGLAVAWLSQDRDPDVFARWVAGLQGAVRDAAVAQIVEFEGPDDPGGALGWVLTMSDPEARRLQARKVAGVLGPARAAEAAALVAASSLPEAEKAELRSLIRDAVSPPRDGLHE